LNVALVSGADPLRAARSHSPTNLTQLRPILCYTHSPKNDQSWLRQQHHPSHPLTWYRLVSSSLARCSSSDRLSWPPPDPTTLPSLTRSRAADIQHNLALLQRAVNLFEPRFTTRALRSLPALRKKVGEKGEFLAEVIRKGKIYEDGKRPSGLLQSDMRPVVGEANLGGGLRLWLWLGRASLGPLSSLARPPKLSTRPGRPHPAVPSFKLSADTPSAPLQLRPARTSCSPTSATRPPLPPPPRARWRLTPHQPRARRTS